MAEFILVHGAWHGAWCWDDLIPALAKLGHRAQAVDLPGGGADQTPLHEVTLDGFARVIAERVGGLSEKAWLVGHSMGGICISAAAELMPDRIGGLVYLSAALPRDGQTLFEAMGDIAVNPSNRPGRLQEVMIVDEATGYGSVPSEHVKDCFYHLCSDEQIDRAQRNLREWQSFGPSNTPVSFSADRGQRVARFYIECLQDRSLTIDMQRHMHRTAGVEMVISLDADHSPFFSCPAELAQALDRFVQASAEA